MGWNRVEHAGDLRLFEGIPSGAHFYFVHSFYPVVARSVVAGTVSTVLTEGGLREEQVAPHARSDASGSRSLTLRSAWCDYGVRFAAAIEIGRIHATQFHPEKSQRWGLRMLENFAAVVKSGR
jgi:glutamine amidotransferase